MKWETGHDESVKVNQRALIDKVLARYSGEFTVFRELLQNSDDAQSKTVEIRFQTQDFLDGEHTTGSGGREALPDLKTTSASPYIDSLVLCSTVTGTSMGLQEQWGHLQGRRLESA